MMSWVLNFYSLHLQKNDQVAMEESPRNSALCGLFWSFVSAEAREDVSWAQAVPKGLIRDRA